MRGKIGMAIAGLGLLVGCAPMGPPPPLFGPGPWGGVGLLLLVVIGAGIYFLVKKSSSEPAPRRDQLVETLNDIHERLKRLEEKIDAMEKGKDLDKED
ncbi:MAG: hypothetical protein JRJ48_07075 [Deltaproteobacteria bacterium]|nr:hypothetical protein [Deltaproteobacteria bacterium]